MKVAIFHHHLNRGGVTQVIANQLRSLNEVIGPDQIDVFLFYGGRQAAWPQALADELPFIRLHYSVVEGLDYVEECRAATTGRDLAETIEDQFRHFGLTTDNCILHIHNHSLGRNWAFNETIHKFQSAGYRMLLQIHDFAEDFRPDNYRRLKESVAADVNLVDYLYPAAEHVMYGVINRRDASYLGRQGIPTTAINYLPNPVSTVPGLTPTREAKSKLEKLAGVDAKIPFLVYPVRGIRRKNVGEAVLLTLLAEQPIQIGLTLPPLNPVESAIYKLWTDLSRQLRLSVWFELGKFGQLTFADVLSAADQIVTTSVAEGFGMVFLEAFAIGKPLIGRDIPQITTDFVEAGITFENLYEKIRIPLDSLFVVDYQLVLSDILSGFFQSYDIAFDQQVVSAMVAKIVDQGWIDFAKLPTEMQRDFVRTAYCDAGVRAQLRELNQPVGQRLVDSGLDQLTIATNRHQVQQHFSFSTIGRQLLEIYQRLEKTVPRPWSPQGDGNRLIECFLNPEGFFPIRFEKINESTNQQTEWQPVVDASSNPLQPIPTSLEPRLQQLPDIRVVMFDIYGTLLVSSSGDVGTDEKFERTDSDLQSDRLSQMLAEVGLGFSQTQAVLKQAILAKHEAARQHSVPHPEIDIVQIWKQLIQSGGGQSAQQGKPKRPRRWIEELALRYELVSNPVYPMPGMRETVDSIRGKSLKLGIISNAQFYTPLILAAFCQTGIEELGFDRRLTFFSYCFGKGKPDLFLYEYAANVIAELGFEPGQVLYVGNDMTKDMVPAKTVGFKTGLFAGDQRSLRLGQHTRPLTTTSVDLILTELTQIDECISNQN